MLSDEEKEAIEGIKKDDEYYDILENIKQNKYNMWNVEKLMRDSTTGDYTEYEITQSIVYFVNLIEKQQKELDKLRNKNKDLLRKLRNRVKQVKKLEKYALYKKEFSRLNKELEKKDREIQIKNNYLDLIWQTGYDYDGLNKVESLKELIDELVDYAIKAKKNDDKSVMYEGHRGKEIINQNILFEKVVKTNG